jgi:hypothetical protein
VSAQGNPGARDARAEEAISRELALSNNESPSKKQLAAFVVTLRAESHVVDPVYALRRLLKTALRQYGLRALSVEQQSPAYDANGDIARRRFRHHAPHGVRSDQQE